MRTLLSAVVLSAAALSARAAEPTESKGDPRALALMQESHKARYSWSPSVSGVSGKFAFTIDGKAGTGTFDAVLRKRGGITVTVSDESVKERLEHHIRSLIQHRTPAAAGSTREAIDYVIVVEDEDRGPLIMPLGDALHSTYRVKNGQLVQVNRAMHGVRFSINVQGFEKMADGRQWTTGYTVTSWKHDTGARVSHSTTTTDGFHNVGGEMFPKAEKVVLEKGGAAASTVELKYSDIKFVSAASASK